MNAIQQVLIGGNHLASVLINRLGCDESRFPPYMSSYEQAQAAISDPETLDIWVAWAAIGRLAQATREARCDS